MADKPNHGQKPFPSAKEGATDDDIFAEMGRMLAQDQLNPPAPAKPATATATAQNAAATKVADKDPLDLTHIVKAGKSQPARPAAGTGSAAPIVATSPPTPRSQGTKIGEAVAMLEGEPKRVATPKPAISPDASGAMVSSRSLDAIVQDAARPMIQAWIDQNMERIVREEAAKVAAKVSSKP